MALASAWRARVFLRKEVVSSLGQNAAVFEKCILRSLGCTDMKMLVSFQYKDGALTISPGQGNGVRLEHPSGCPCCFLTASDLCNITPEVKEIGVGVGVAVLVQSADNKVLITRRSKHLRTFPGVWVPPGGHIEQEETIYDAAFRELKEEAGISLSPANCKTLVLGLWESVYPPLLAAGLPKRHHIVLYLLARSQQTSSALQQQLKLDGHEVDAAAWLDEHLVQQMTKSDDYGQVIKTPQKYFEATELIDGVHQPKNLPQSILMVSAPKDCSDDISRLSTGTKFALRQWLKVLYDHENSAGMKKTDSLGAMFQAITKEGHQPIKAPFWLE